MYYTYVLRSRKDRRLYVGKSKDLKTRFEEHQKGYVSSTAERRPFELIYYEACRNNLDAARRERYLKTSYGKMFLKKRLKSDSTGWNLLRRFHDINPQIGWGFPLFAHIFPHNYCLALSVCITFLFWLIFDVSCSFFCSGCGKTCRG